MPTVTRSGRFWAGVRAELPLLVGVAPFGLIYGITAMAAGMPAWAAQSMSFIILGGSAQFVVAQLFAVNTPALVIVVTVFVINLRHALYSASLVTYFESLHLAWRGLLAYLLTDEAYVVAITDYQQNPSLPHKAWYLLGAGMTLWTAWQITTALGIFLGASVPADWPLDFALPLTFIALMVPLVRDRAGVAAGVAAGLVVLVAAGLPFKLGLLVAALAGMVAGLLAEGRSTPAKRMRKIVKGGGP
jgi:4-azaleucine resistance transporter AzlC